MGDVDPSARPLGQHEVPGDDGFFRDGGYALQAQPGGVASLVHVSAGSERRVFAVHENGQVEHSAVFEGPAQDGRIPDGPAGIGQRHGAGLGQFAGFCQAFAPASGGDRGDGMDPRRRACRPLPYEFHGGRVVDDRLGVRHACYGRDAARGSRERAAFQSLPVLESGFAEMGVQIDQARQDEQAVRIDDRGAFRLVVRRPVDDPAVAHPEIALLVAAGSGVDDASVLDYGEPRAFGCAADGIRSVRPHRARLRR